MATYYDADGNEVEAIPVEEATKIQQERDTLAQEREALLAEKQRLEAGSTDKDENFRKFRASQEETEKKLKEVNEKLAQKEEYERTSAKNTLIQLYAGDDADARKRLEEEYALINIDESNPENIAKRFEKAARVSGLYKEQYKENPIFKGSIWGGSAPTLKQTGSTEDDADNIVNTDKGKSALAAMGVPTE